MVSPVVGKIVARYIAAVHVTFDKKSADEELTVFNVHDPFDQASFLRLLRLVLKLNYLEYAKYDYGCTISCMSVLLPVEKVWKKFDELLNIFRAQIEEINEEDLGIPKKWVLEALKNVDNGDLDALQYVEKPEYTKYSLVESEESKREMFIRLKFMPCMFLVVAKSGERLEEVIDTIDDPIISDWEIEYLSKFLTKYTYRRKGDEIFYIMPIPGKISEIIDIYTEFVEDLKKKLSKEKKKRKKKQTN